MTLPFAAIAWPKLVAILALLAAAGGLAWFAALPALPVGAQATTDYDADDNNLIDISTVAQLNAMRWDLDGDGDPSTGTGTPIYNAAFPNRDTATSTRMGCPSPGCSGYELTADLAADGSNALSNWTVIASFATTFDGQGHTLTGGQINVTSTADAGLFSLAAAARIRDVGLIDFNVTSTSADARSNGTLVGFAASGSVISGAYAQGGTVAVSTNNSHGGGLVGNLAGTVRASYSTAAVSASGSATSLRIGGLVGNLNGGTVIASYAAGSVVSTNTNADAGGLAGQVASSPTITDSYCDSTVTGSLGCVGTGSGATAVATSTAALQNPIGYAGIYANWNIDLDGDSNPDDPWYFGTPEDYPRPSYLRPTAAVAGAMDYDADDNNLIDVSTVAQLHAVRYDLDGDGDPEANTSDAYIAAFPGRTTTTTGRMGCPATCTGYELTASLTFPSSADSPHNPWTPIGAGIAAAGGATTTVTFGGAFNATFDGRGYTLTGLTVSAVTNAGLFSSLGASAVVRDLGLLNPTVAAANGLTTRSYAGALAGQNYGTIQTTYVQGGSVAMTAPNPRAGGLVGLNSGQLSAVYSTAAVSNTGSTSTPFLGGLVGRHESGGITASYAAAAITTAGVGPVAGGLVGQATGTPAVTTITASYCDTTVQAGNCVGAASDAAIAAAGHSTTDLTTPVGYTGIYVAWNLNLEGDSAPDHPWNFLTNTDYPRLNSPAQRLAAQAAAATVDYDTDDNNLIEIGNLAQLDAVRYDPDGDGVPSGGGPGMAAYAAAFPNHVTSSPGRMGCAATCTGYELSASLTFPAAAGAHNPWRPIGAFRATFDGNGHTLTGMTVTISGGGAGLFGSLQSSAIIRDLGMVNPDVTTTGPQGYPGGIAGIIYSGAEVTASYVRGGSVTVASGNSRAGGLAGVHQGTITASYSTAAVSVAGAGAGNQIGGLVGRNMGGTIIASYAAGAVSVTGTSTGGLAGTSDGAGAAITNSYCDITVSPGNCIGSQTGAVVTADGKTTAELQTPADYTGIYVGWNLELTGDAFPDNPWHFGAANEYPVPLWARPAAAPIDYDADDNNLIEVSDVTQLYAIRYDLDGNGAPVAGAENAYQIGFPYRMTGMGCAATCAGYELMADLALPAMAPYNPWAPIGGTYDATFDGNGRSITGLVVNYGGDAGLFSLAGGSSVIRDLAIIAPSVTATNNFSNAGGLVGETNAGSSITSVYVQGGSITVAQSGSAGGLVGIHQGAIRASGSTASIGATAGFVQLGGLVGSMQSSSITASYSAGAVSGSSNNIAGLVGISQGNTASIIDSYCDSEASGQSACVGSQSDSSSVSATATSTAALQEPTGYEDTIYANWNLDLDNPPDGTPDDPWYFGSPEEYPVPWYLVPERAWTGDSPPPSGPPARGPVDTPYNPVTDHPEIYEIAQYEMSATCQVQNDAEGRPASSTVTIDLGSYQNTVILHLSLWNGEVYMSYESQDIARPPVAREGQTLTVRVTTDPARTRFRLDSVSPTRNLVLGYADCRDDAAIAAAAAAAQETADSDDAAATTTDAAAADTLDAKPKIYTNDRYEMTASCEVHYGAEGEATGSTISFNLGSYESPVILHLSINTGDGIYMSYESQDIAMPAFEREDQMATVVVVTDPGQTRFRLDSVSPTSNLILGYADCRDAGG